MRTIHAGVARVGRATGFAVGLAVILAVALGVATTALAAVPGDPFRLGRINTIGRISQLVGSATTPLLRIDNNGTGSALDLRVEPGRPPMTVNADAGKAANLNADKLDGREGSAFARAYERTVVVGPVGTPEQNGAALKNALAGITNASESNPYLLKIEPGVYDVGSQDTPLAMKPWVDIEGSGEGVTTLTASGDSNTGAVVGADNAELRFLTVESVGDFFSIAVYNPSASSLRLTNVTAAATAPASGGSYAVENSGTLTLTQVTATGSGGGVNFGVFNSGSLTMTQTTIRAMGNDSLGVDSEGVRTQAGDASTDIRHSDITADDHTIVNYGDTRVSVSQLAEGPVLDGVDDGVVCAGVYDENYTFYTNGCPTDAR